MKILLENLGGASSQPNTLQGNTEDMQIAEKGKVPHESGGSEGMFNSKAEYVQVEGSFQVQIQQIVLTETLQIVLTVTNILYI